MRCGRTETGAPETVRPDVLITTRRRGVEEAVIGRTIRASAYELQHQAGFFERDPGFVAECIQISPGASSPNPSMNVLPFNGPFVRKRMRGVPSLGLQLCSSQRSTNGGANTGLTSPSFGQQSTAQANDPRTGQLSFRIQV